MLCNLLDVSIIRYSHQYTIVYDHSYIPNFLVCMETSMKLAQIRNKTNKQDMHTFSWSEIMILVDIINEFFTLPSPK